MSVERFARLFESYEIGSLKIQNRFVMPAMGTGFANNGYVTPQMINYYTARASGGVGLIIIENTCVEQRLGRIAYRLPQIDEDRFIPGLIKLVDSIHKYGAKVALQIAHGGRVAIPPDSNDQPIAPSPIPVANGRNYWGFEKKSLMPREMSVEDIKEILSCFVNAAKRAKAIGFDGIEIHAAHSYLLAQFLSRAWNRRNDQFGGLLENRAKLLIDIIRTIKDALGENYPVWFRINAREYGVANGTTISEACATSKLLEKAGADALNVSAIAWGPSSQNKSPMSEKPGSMIHLAEKIKSEVSIPIIAVGRITPEVGEIALREKKTDFVAIGKGLIADPEVVNKTKMGNIDDIRPCILCLSCLDSVGKNEALVCSVNPIVGKECEFVINPARRRKKVLVVGGGPAGMYTANVAALRGHEVLLYEKEKKLGGQLNFASLPNQKERIKDLVIYMQNQLNKSGVVTKVGIEVTPTIVKQLKPDIVILATGSIPRTPEIPGLNEYGYITYKEALLDVKVGESVVVIGGGMIGCEIAEYLADKCKHLTIMEIQSILAADMVPPARTALLNRLLSKGVIMLTDIKCESIQKGNIVFSNKNKIRETVVADTIVLAAGHQPDNFLAGVLKDRISELHLVGDCNKSGNIRLSIHDAMIIAYAI